MGSKAGVSFLMQIPSALEGKYQSLSAVKIEG